MTNNEILLKFLQNQKLITMASIDNKGKPWVSNAYYSVDKNMNFFFVSSPDTRHSMDIKINSEVAFSVAWFDQDNIEDRKAIQGTGVCEQVTAISEVLQFIKSYDESFPEWKGGITLEKVKEGLLSARPYVIRSKYIKFWNDELYGEKRIEEFKF